MPDVQASGIKNFLELIYRKAGTYISMPPIVHDSRFRRYWAASSISVLGDSVWGIAVSITAISVLDANSFELGLITALEWAPVIFSLHLGFWADRVGRPRLLMVACDVVCFIASVSIPISQALGVLSLEQIYVVVLIAGVAVTLFKVCESSFFATLVPGDQYAESQSLLYGSQAVASLAGPGVGGLLLQLISAPFVIVVDSFSYLFSAVMLGSVRLAESRADRESKSHKLTSGLKFIRHNDALRRIISLAATVNFFNIMFSSLIAYYLIHYLGASSVVVGTVMVGQAAGALIGSAVAPQMARIAGAGYALMAGSIAISAPLMFVPAIRGNDLPAIVAAFSALLVSGFGRAVQNVSIGTTFARTVPEGMRSQVRGSFQFVSSGASPVGAFLGGIMGSVIGIRPTLWIAAAGGLLAFLWILPVKVIDEANAEIKMNSSS